MPRLAVKRCQLSYRRTHLQLPAVSVVQITPVIQHERPIVTRCSLSVHVLLQPSARNQYSCSCGLRVSDAVRSPLMHVTWIPDDCRYACGCNGGNGHAVQESHQGAN
jgi:hypothetical protein